MFHHITTFEINFVCLFAPLSFHSFAAGVVSFPPLSKTFTYIIVMLFFQNKIDLTLTALSKSCALVGIMFVVLCVWLFHFVTNASITSTQVLSLLLRNLSAICYHLFCSANSSLRLIRMSFGFTMCYAFAFEEKLGLSCC